MIGESTIRTLVEEFIADKGLYIVDVSVGGANQIKVEIDQMEGGLSIQKCIDLSRHIENSLDREQEDFELQVSSPGMDQKFKVHEQYQKSEGKQVEIYLKDGRNMKGTLLKVDDEGVELETTKKERVEGKKKKQTIVEVFPFSFEEIEKTKRVISFK